MTLSCKDVTGLECPYVAPNAHALGGHIGAHRKRGELDSKQPLRRIPVADRALLRRARFIVEKLGTDEVIILQQALHRYGLDAIRRTPLT